MWARSAPYVHWMCAGYAPDMLQMCPDVNLDCTLDATYTLECTLRRVPDCTLHCTLECTLLH